MKIVLVLMNSSKPCEFTVFFVLALETALKILAFWKRQCNGFWLHPASSL